MRPLTARDIEAIQEGLAVAVDRYDAMGFFEGDEGERAEAELVEAASKAADAAKAKPLTRGQQKAIVEAFEVRAQNAMDDYDLPPEVAGDVARGQLVAIMKDVGPREAQAQGLIGARADFATVPPAEVVEFLAVLRFEAT